MVFGTPHYMSPEQASGGVVDARTDVYALGVIMYEMFTGRVPFEADTYMGVLTKHMFEAPMPPSQVAGPAKELGALEDVTLKALAKRPEDRYASMNALVVDLDRILSIGPDGRPLIAAKLEGLSRPDFKKDAEAVRRSLSGLADELEPPARAEIAAAHANDRERRVRKLGVVAVGGVLIVGLGISLAAIASRGREPTPDKPTPVPRQLATKESTSVAAPGTTASAEPVLASAPVPAASPASDAPATATPKPSQHPTQVTKPPKPPSKSLGSGEEDPWAK
jgi:serine/threonine-protein kinase